MPASAAFFWVRFSVLRRRRKAIDALESVSERPDEPPGLYLRSFRNDPVGRKIIGRSTEEEQLALVFDDLGPFVAIGRPEEALPELGTARIYVKPELWQKVITGFMSKAQLVVMRIGLTEGFWWEVQRAIKKVRPVRPIFLVPRDEKLYEEFRGQVKRLLPRPLAEYVKGWSDIGFVGKAVR